MKNLNKIFSVLMWVLIIASVAILVWGFAVGYPASPAMDNGTVDPLIYWTYTMLGIAVFCVVVLGIVIAAVNNPKSLVKLGIGIVVIAAVCFGAYLLAAGAPAMGIVGEQPDQATLKLTDTILNLTYLAGGLAILSIVAGEIVGAVRNK